MHVKYNYLYGETNTLPLLTKEMEKTELEKLNAVLPVDNEIQMNTKNIRALKATGFGSNNGKEPGRENS